ncbi:hypothetical protein HU200_002397 [Digitaria exilis]|uniref:UDP-glycosyltransferases domain-containing protein n=1 Tax=Digitaria exilis TaxID=1010633 RepID=A0A835FY92_9POAL|nr:hypothetical protein HU200_002397 [Digitaria exilis]
MVCTFCMPWVVEVARQHKIPLVVLWIQSAAALVTYYHYFHGHDEIIAPHITDPAYEVSLPGLNPLRIRDMPTFFVAKMHNVQHEMFLKGFRDFIEQMDQDKPLVMVNTFDALEHRAIEAMKPYMDVAIGPAVTLLGANGAAEDGKNYEGWLDTQPKKSVVYVSFGSLVTYTKQQVEEILHGLHKCGRPFLWVVRKEGRTEDVDSFLGNIKGGNGMIVEWCNQLQVLSHPSIGSFVTHCGWNSILEALVSGLPMVAVPNWSDQPLSACLVEKEWGVGIRAECNTEGVLTSAELVKSVELLMGNSEKATKIKENTSNLKQRAQEAIATDGLSERNLRIFFERVQHV